MSKYRILPRVTGYTRTEVVSAVRSVLQMDKETRIHCLELLIDCHTRREKKVLMAIEDDNRGFGKIDLPRMFFIHKKIQRKEPLTKEDDRYLANHIPHYAEQYILLLGAMKTTTLVNTYYKE